MTRTARLTILGIGLLTVLAACASTDSSTGPGESASTDPAETDTADPSYRVPEGLIEVEVVRVSDGDSFDVRFEGRNDRVRMLGMNANESDECFGAEAGEFLAALLDDGPVRLETSPDRDDFDRMLALVWIDGELVNDTMVRTGYTLARDLSGHRFADEFEEAELAAKSAGLGLWAADACGAATTNDIRIADLFPNAPGRDQENPNGEWVELENTGAAAVDLTGWTVKDESTRHRYQFRSGFVLDAGDRVRIFSGCGNDSAIELYWCEEGTSVWTNSGDAAFVLDPAGNIIDTLSYTGP